jgi:hypothetical protein
MALLHLTEKLHEIGIIVLMYLQRVSQVNGHYLEQRDVVSN